jgi:acetyltransferase
LGLPPLTTTLARHLMESTRIYRALRDGVRGQKPGNLDALQKMLVHFSQLLLEQKWIREIDINPLWVTADGVLAMDARILLHEAEVTEDTIPEPAIRPYPIQYEAPWTLRDGRRVLIRPIRPDDETLIVKLHEDLSEQSVYYYFFHPVKFSQRTSHARLMRICFLDYDRQITLIAEYKDTTSGERKILGGIRLIKQHGKNEAEFAMILAESAQGQGLGTEMLKRIIEIAKDEQLDVLTADILPDNHRMKRLCEKFEFQMKRTPDDPVIQARLDLK